MGKSMRKNRQKQAGFTLLELLIIIVAIIITVVIIISLK
jgi:type II secretory pathway pseudopilin PulG